MTALLLPLLLAHILGDFVFQPTSWVAHKKALKVRSKYLYGHVGLHLLLMLLLTRFELRFIPAVLLLALSHGIIDLVKLYADKRGSLYWFVSDQLLHLLAIALAVYAYFPFEMDWQTPWRPKWLWLLFCVVLATYAASVLLKFLLAKWNVSVRAAGSSNNAGRYIGLLERAFVFYFAATGFWEGIGFLLAAKSIFRFGDLKDSNDIKLTEYILIGTLLSFGIAMGCAILYRHGLAWI